MFVNSDCLLRWLERNRVDNGAAIREHYINWSRVFACPHQLQVVQMSVMTRVIAKCHVCEEHLITCLTSDEHITLNHSIILFKWRCRHDVLGNASNSNCFKINISRKVIKVQQMYLTQTSLRKLPQGLEAWYIQARLFQKGNDLNYNHTHLWQCLSYRG